MGCDTTSQSVAPDITVAFMQFSTPILNTYYLLFPNTDKDNIASDCYEDLAAACYWLAYKLKNLKAFEHKRKKLY